MAVVRTCVHCQRPLSRHNSALVCGACETARRGSEQSRAALKLPADLLVSEAFVKSAQSWDWPSLLRAVSAATDATQSQIAEATGLRQQEVSRLMNGRTLRPDIDKIRGLCDGLGMPRELAGLAPRPGATSTGAYDESMEDIANRRQFLRLVGATAASTLAFGDKSLLTDPHVPDFEAEIGQLEAATREIFALEDQHGGVGWLCRLATGVVQRADALLQHDLPSDRLVHQTQAVASELAIRAGWLYYDAGDQHSAHAHWQYAMSQAQLSEDPQTEVNAMQSLSTQATSALDRPREGVRLARRAQSVAQGWASSRLLSLLQMREAQGWARMRDMSSFGRATTRAKQTFDKSRGGGDDEPRWLDFYGYGELIGLEAMGNVRAERFDRAEALLRTTTDEIGDSLRRNQIFYISVLGRTLAEQDDLSGAAETLQDHLPAIADSGSWRAQIHAHRAVECARESQSSRARVFADAAVEAGVA